MTDLWRSACGRYSVQIGGHVIDQMVRMAKTHAPNEVGTALVGTYSTDGFRATVTGLAPFTSDSQGRRATFQRGGKGLKVFFSRLFQSSNGREFYVGEWHSHPGGYPEPSGVDDRNVFAITQDPREHCPECILLILGLRQQMDIGVFVYSSRGDRTELIPITNPECLGNLH